MKNLFVGVLVFGTTFAHAGNFTPAEISEHKKALSTIVPTATDCLERVYDDHIDFHGRWGVSKYYGDRKYKRTDLPAVLRSYNAPSHLVSELEPISCIGLTMKCLKEGFAAADTLKTWSKIETLLGKDKLGMVLQTLLQELGWKVLYWNPDPSSNAKWDAEDKVIAPLKPGKTWNPIWGGHADRYRTVQTKNVYFNLRVDDKTTMVGFKDVMPAAFKKIPFFVGTAHAGYHVFPGSFGTIIEAHSMRNLDSILNLETSPFNPLAMGGGPRWTKIEKYRSGIVVVPPTF